MNTTTNWYDGIIGYEAKKAYFSVLIDEFNNYERYKKANACFPNFLIFDGAPGLGKTLFATKISNALHGQHFLLRKEESKEDLIRKIDRIFALAIANAPSVVVLDDLDKYVSDENDDAFGVIQSAIDKIQEKQARVFVIATTNCSEDLPGSLIRPGRFNILPFHLPKKSSSDMIIKNYLKDKCLAQDVDLDFIGNLLFGCTCADLKAIIERAAMFSCYHQSTALHQMDLIKAFLSIKMNMDCYTKPIDNEANRILAYHEIGHAFISDYYQKDSVLLVAIDPFSLNSGVTLTKHNYENDVSYQKNMVYIKKKLAGHILVDLKFLLIDGGSCFDLDSAQNKMKSQFFNDCSTGYHDLKTNLNENSLTVLHQSNDLLQQLDLEIREIFFKNMPLLDSLANKLLQDQFLYGSEIAKALKQAK